MNHDWYRSVTWNLDQEKYFFDKIERARSSKNQYLYIQAYILLDTANSNYLSGVFKILDYFFSMKEYDLFDLIRLLPTLELYFSRINDKATSFDISRFIVMELLPLEGSDPSNYRLNFAEKVLKFQVIEDYSYCFEMLSKMLLEEKIPFTSIEYYKVYIYLARLYQIDQLEDDMKTMINLAQKFKKLPRNGIFQNIKYMTLGLVKKDDYSVEQLLEVKKQDHNNTKILKDTSSYWLNIKDEIRERSVSENWSK